MSTEGANFFEQAGLPMAVLETGGRLAAANPVWHVLAANAEGATLVDQLRTTERDEAGIALARTLSEGSAVFEGRFLPGGDRERAQDAWYAFRLSLSERGDRVYVTAWEITKARTRARKMNVLGHLLEATPVFLTAADRDGTINLSEGRGLAVLGFGPTDVIGLDIRELYRDTELETPIRRALEGHDTYARCTFPNGCSFDHWYTPFFDNEGRVDGVIGIAVDTTAQREAETALRAKVAEIEQKDVTIRALATPVLRVWDDVLCVPVVGVVDDARAAEMTSTLLDAITQSRARFVVIDLTGVESLDTPSAQHLLQLLRAAGLLGVVGVLSGVRPAVARSLVELEIGLEGVRTTLHLQEALRTCIQERTALARNGTERRNDQARAR